MSSVEGVGDSYSYVVHARSSAKPRLPYCVLSDTQSHGGRTVRAPALCTLYGPAVRVRVQSSRTSRITTIFLSGKVLDSMIRTKCMYS